MANIAPAPDLPEEEEHEPEEQQTIVNPLQVATYTQWLANADNDPFRLSYSTVLNHFDSGNNKPEGILLE